MARAHTPAGPADGLAPPEPSTATPAPAGKPQRWIGLHLPWLSLESFAATLSGGLEGQALALVDLHHVIAANEQARAQGVHPGLKRATALALAPQLVLGQVDAHRDAQALLSVGHAALAFTPMVCLCPPDGVLLEVQASLRYFKGHDALLHRLRDALVPLGHRVQFASAPTAQGALWLARLASPERTLCAPDLAVLQRWLDAAPLGLPEAAAEHAEAWQAMGLRTLGDLRRLPRAGLARRFGTGLLDEIDRAFGDRPDPREPLHLPPVFDSELELFARADNTAQLLHGAEVLLMRLVAWLSARHAFVRRFELHMKHEPRWRNDSKTPPCTVLTLALTEPSRDTAHLLSLLRERLATLTLPAPTLDLALHAHDIAHQPPPNDELFPTPRGEREGLVRLIERLQARLGRERVQRLVPLADHRPEKATACQPADGGLLDAQRLTRAARALPGGAARHPVWLLSEPLPLHESPQAAPLLAGHPVSLLAGPERIETGWWDGDLAERDYFVAQTREGTLAWLYRRRIPVDAAQGANWFLQGWFG